MARYSHERKQALLNKLLPPYNLTVAELARQTHSLPVLAALREWLDAALPVVVPKGKLGERAGCLPIRQRGYLFSGANRSSQWA